MNKIVDIFTGIIVVAGIMVMVRPNSQGPNLVSAVANGMTGMLKAATGGGTW
jgi:hypothetical protein